MMNLFLGSLYPIIIKFTISLNLWFLCITVYFLKLKLEMWSKSWGLNGAQKYNLSQEQI